MPIPGMRKPAPEQELRPTSTLKRISSEHAVDNDCRLTADRDLRIDITNPAGERRSADMPAYRHKAVQINVACRSCKLLVIYGKAAQPSTTQQPRRLRRSEARTTLVQAMCPSTSVASNILLPSR